MSYYCPNCESENLRRKGKFYNQTANREKQRFECKDCGTSFSLDMPIVNSAVNDKTVKSGKRFVFTSCQNDTTINEKFFAALQNYCDINGAELMVLKSEYNAVPYDNALYNVPDEYLVDWNTDIGNHVKVYAALNILATAENPIGGLDSLSKGKSLIIGHPQLQMRTLPVNESDHPIIITTTGTISNPNYKESKQGFKAEFNHSYSAIVLEVDDKNDLFHLRVLNCDDDNGFYDVNGYYSDDSYNPDVSATAIVVGDEHALFADDDVVRATYTDKKSLVNTLRPKYIVRHDVVDSYSITHHDRNNFLRKFKKHVEGQDKIEDELKITLDYIEKTTPKFAENLIVDSNHHSHITRWLNEVNIKEEPWNARFYHYMMYRVLDVIQNSGEIPNPFELYITAHSNVPVKFVSSHEPMYIHGIDVSNHGDKGANGARFSPTGGAKMPSKMVVGHSHSPRIEKGCYIVGTMTKLMDYAKGCPSSWMNTHCIIYPNGKRQLINIIHGKWKL